MSTACYHGFICSYEIDESLVDESRLLLARLEMGLAEGDEERELFGVAPQRRHAEAFHRNAVVYDPLAAPVAFTGRLLLGAGRVGIYLNMGFQPAWLYERVHELAFSSGRLESTVDRSAELAEVRQRIGEAGARPRDGEDTKDWIHRTFSRTFDYSWPGGQRSPGEARPPG